MEFQFASLGSTAELRSWLRQHPDRVNIPSSCSNYTLLHTAVKCGHLDTVKMLMGEFRADAGIPCGGMNNTCVHTAAANGDVDVLSFLLTTRPLLRPNAFMECPRDVAEASSAKREAKEKCIAMLLEYEHGGSKQQEKQKELRSERGSEQQAMQHQFPQRPPSPIPPVSTTTFAPLTSVVYPHLATDTLRDTIRDLKVESDGDGCDYNNNNRDQKKKIECQSLRPESKTPKRSHTPPAFLSRKCGMSFGHENQSPGSTRGSGGDTERIGLRNEHVIPTKTRLPLDLLLFRRMYGDAFDFKENADAYFIRGLVPYTFKAVVYYTPVIIILRKPRESREKVEEEQQQQQGRGGDGGWTELPSLYSGLYNTSSTTQRHGAFTYRALIDRKKLGDLFISRRATYIDPCSAAIIPSEADAYYHNILDFVRCAIVNNFERLPPLTALKEKSACTEESIPLFRLYPNQREVTARILRDLSFFCDGAFIYHRSTKSVEGFLPIFLVFPPMTREEEKKKRIKSDGKSHVLDGTKVIASCPNAKKIINPSEDAHDIMDSDLVMKLPLRMQFVENSAFDDPPRVYLLNATTASSLTRMNYDFLSKIIFDSSNGEVHSGTLRSLADWKTHGSIFSVLLELQEKVTSLLLEYCEKSTQTPVMRGEVKPPTVKKQGVGSSRTVPYAQSQGGSSGSPMDSEDDMGFLLVGKPVSGSTTECNSTNTATLTSKSKPEDIKTATKCVVCMEAEKNILFLPCRHLVLCYNCSLRYKDRLADDMICPICRVPIETMLEVFS